MEVAISPGKKKTECVEIRIVRILEQKLITWGGDCTIES